MCRNPIHCFLPPHVLDRIARNGNKEQRDVALRTLHSDTTLRLVRATALPPVPTSPMATLGTTPGKPHRTIYDCAGSENTHGAKVVRKEGAKASKDVAVNEAYDGLGDTYSLYWDIFHRDSIDDEGLPLNAYVHYGQQYDNAFWDGAEMIFGDGDGQLFNRFTISVDVIGHELTHGVTQDEAGLQYTGQSGALNESLSDVFGSLVKQYALKQTADKADWLIGAGLLASGVSGVALRSMAHPGTAYDDKVLGKDPQPDNMSGFVHTTQDNGGVHINSGIPNRAFYLVATAIGGNAWEHAGQIWYETVRDPKLRPTATFKRFATLTVQNAARIYGGSSTEADAVVNAWKTVGVKVTHP
jgi:Zn-dependent metalloprotease